MLTTAEREQVFRCALEQARAHRTANEARLRQLQAEHSRCRSCHDPDSHPMYDGANGIVCGICGEEWR